MGDGRWVSAESGYIRERNREGAEIQMLMSWGKF